MSLPWRLAVLTVNPHSFDAAAGVIRLRRTSRKNPFGCFASRSTNGRMTNAVSFEPAAPSASVTVPALGSDGSSPSGVAACGTPELPPLEGEFRHFAHRHRAGRFRAMWHRGGVDPPQPFPLACVCAPAGLRSEEH